MANDNKSLSKANKAKKDEFYTQLVDIENELKHYKDFFRDKTVFCNCDDPFESNFVKYFAMNFKALGLKKLIATCYATSPVMYTQLSFFDTPVEFEAYGTGKKPYKIEITEVSDENGDGAVDLEDFESVLKKHPPKLLEGDGDFRSAECIALLKQADVVVTNPPFSLFREYVAQLMEYQKKFIIIGNQNAITYKEIFPLIKENKIWLGYKSGDMAFTVPDNYEARETRFWIDSEGQHWRSMGNICWYTNIDIKKRHEKMILYKSYTPEEYPHYDNYDAIEVSKTADIPMDYAGVMGVPITFMDKYNPEQFEIVGNEYSLEIDKGRGYINGKRMYSRIFIKTKGLNMEIRLEEHTIAELIDGYIDSAENGVVGYGGRLNIRPAFQREFVYKEKERNAVIDTVMKGFPLNVMYWVEDEKGNYELLDGQQRTLSICQYCSGDFSVMIDGKPRAFHNLTAYERQKILDYRLMIYICKGNDKEKLDWFQTINIAGMVLTAQELRNAVYTGPWLSDAKRYFSKNGCAAYKLANKYLNGEMNRQAYLEKAIKWAADKEKMSIDEYMAKYQNATDATALWMYFTSVINWVKILFPVHRKEMKGLEWGILYNRYHTNSYYPMKMEMTISILMADREVTKKSGVYEYMLSEDEKHLSIRKFDEQDRRQKYEQQQGICPICRKYFDYTKMHADHITPWHAGGKTVYENLQMLCRDCNLKKSGQE